MMFSLTVRRKHRSISMFFSHTALAPNLTLPQTRPARFPHENKERVRVSEREREINRQRLRFIVLFQPKQRCQSLSHFLPLLLFHNM